LENAISRFGASLTDVEKQLVRGLNPDDLRALNDIRSKLGRLGPLAEDNNNNNAY
jgi:hypothetical protein